MLTKFKEQLNNVLPIPVWNLLRVLRNWRDFFPIMAFLRANLPGVTVKDKIRIVKQVYIITFNIDSPHTQDEILSFIQTILSLPPESKGIVVEAGCFKGSSTAKFSLAADIADRTLVVFDSFEGIPANDEPHDHNIFGGKASFKGGDYCGSFTEVISNVKRFGKIDSCRFIKGWFDDTLPNFREPIAAIYLDVDLASSTRTCLKYLYPLLDRGGVVYSQDGHLPLVIDVFRDDEFWLKEVGYEKPPIQGLGKRKLIRAIKDV